LVEEKEWLPVVGAIVNTNEFTGGARVNGDISVVFPPKRFSYGFAIEVGPPIFDIE